VADAVRHAAVEVFDAVGGRGVDDAGAVFGGGVVGQVHRRQAPVAGVDVVQRVAEFQPAQVLADGGAQHLAFELVAAQRLFDQHFGQDQLAARRVDQRVDDFRIQVQRLVGRDGPG